ncbi:MAG: putative lipoprotein [Fibrobacteres bacterium]|nr:putative lipoprotein [Fibrobacterota bacterium]
MTRFRIGLRALPTLPLAMGLAGLATLLAGCNIFKQAIGIEPETAEEHILEGQILLRKAEYGAAEAEFRAAIGKDSSKSEAYYGAAKCVLLDQHINMFQLLQSFQNNDGKSIPFLSEPDTVKDKIYVANRGINRYLSILAEKDRVGKSDGKVPLNHFSADYALASAIEAVLSLADFNGDGRINSKDNILNGIIDFSDPSKLNPDSIMANIADLKNDTAKISALNGLLEKSQELLANSDKALDLFLNGALNKQDSISGSNCAAADTACQRLKAQLGGTGKEQVGDSAITQVKKFIQDAGSTVVIYKVFDKVDNDGDGCIDEELLDGIDNDGDGRTDEDSRGAPDTAGNVNYHADKDNADNNLDGKIDESGEAAFHLRYQASFQPLQLLLHPERKAEIFWGDSGSGISDTRHKVLLVLDSTATPKTMDTVSTFDLCKGPVKGFKKGK